MKISSYNRPVAKRFILFVVVLSSLFIVFDSAQAWIIGEPVVPCGGKDSAGNAQPACTQCELLHLLDNAADFIMIAATPILATLFFIVAGVYIMLGGANPGMLSQGKRIFTETLTGLIIVMLAWLLVNTLITTLVASNLDLDINGSNYNFNSADWWKVQCDTLDLNKATP